MKSSIFVFQFWIPMCQKMTSLTGTAWRKKDMKLTTTRSKWKTMRIMTPESVRKPCLCISPFHSLLVEEMCLYHQTFQLEQTLDCLSGCSPSSQQMGQSFSNQGKLNPTAMGPHSKRDARERQPITRRARSYCKTWRPGDFFSDFSFVVASKIIASGAAFGL